MTVPPLPFPAPASSGRALARARRAALPALALVLAGALGARPAAQQHQNAYLYTHFDTPVTGVYSVDQSLRVEDKAPASFWPLLWRWEEAGVGGYLGLQTNGSGPQGQQLGETALFSLWDANAVEPAAGSLGGTFGGEGTGFTIRRAFPFRTHTFYRLRVWRLSVEAEGCWWGAWILDTTTGRETYLGRIRSRPEHATIDGQSVETFSEYFGAPQPTCDDVPLSVVRWSLPLVRSGGPDVVGAFAGSVRGSCTGGSAVFHAFPPPEPAGPAARFVGLAGPWLLATRRSALPDVHVVVTLGGPR